jgi:Ca2+-binding RTX toxin-like protein
VPTPVPTPTPNPYADCTILADPGGGVYVGTSGADIMCSRGGFVSFYPLGGNDVIRGHSGPGTDAVYWDGAPSGVTINLSTGVTTGGFGTDTFTNIEEVYASHFGDTIIGSAGVDLVYGFGGDDTISGGGGNDRLHGDSGADSLDGGAGVDYLNGGPDMDSCLNGETVADCE